jgi:hypothetical protein
MKRLVAALAVSTVAFGLVGTAFAQQIECNNQTGCKICSDFLPGVWRDTFVVAKTWTPATCQAYSIFVGATNWQLGCMYSNAFLYGAAQVNTSSSQIYPLAILVGGDENCGKLIGKFKAAPPSARHSAAAICAPKGADRLATRCRVSGSACAPSAGAATCA